MLDGLPDKAYFWDYQLILVGSLQELVFGDLRHLITAAFEKEPGSGRL